MTDTEQHGQQLEPPQRADHAAHRDGAVLRLGAAARRRRLDRCGAASRSRCSCVAMITDKIDGDIARARNLVTDFGKIADPIADKAITGMAFIGLSIVGDIWWWVTILVLLREWSVTLLRLSVLKHVVIAGRRRAARSRRRSRRSRCPACCLPLPHGMRTAALRPGLGEVLFYLSQVLLAGAVAMTLWSGYEFFRDVLAPAARRRTVDEVRNARRIFVRDVTGRSFPRRVKVTRVTTDDPVGPPRCGTVCSLPREGPMSFRDMRPRLARADCTGPPSSACHRRLRSRLLRPDRAGQPRRHRPGHHRGVRRRRQRRRRYNADFVELYNPTAARSPSPACRSSTARRLAPARSSRRPERLGRRPTTLPRPDQPRRRRRRRAPHAGPTRPRDVAMSGTAGQVLPVDGIDPITATRQPRRQRRRRRHGRLRHRRQHFETARTGVDLDGHHLGQAARPAPTPTTTPLTSPSSVPSSGTIPPGPGPPRHDRRDPGHRRASPARRRHRDHPGRRHRALPDRRLQRLLHPDRHRRHRATPGASDAIFVFAPELPTRRGPRRRLVEVTGEVCEFAGLTEITPAGGVGPAAPAAVTPLTASRGPHLRHRRRARRPTRASSSPRTAPSPSPTTYRHQQLREIGLAAGNKPLIHRPRSPTPRHRRRGGHGGQRRPRGRARRRRLDQLPQAANRTRRCRG